MYESTAATRSNATTRSNPAKGGKQTRPEDVARRLAARGVTIDVMREKLRAASPRNVAILKLSLGFDADEPAWIATGAAPLRAPEIAQALGCKPDDVRAVRKQFGIIDGTAARMHEGVFDVADAVDLDAEDDHGAEFLEGFGIRDKASSIDAAVVLETPHEFKARQDAREWLRSMGEDPDAVEHGECRQFANHSAQSLRAAHAAASLMLDARQTLVDAQRGTLSDERIGEWFELAPYALQAVGTDAADLLVSVDVVIEHGIFMAADERGRATRGRLSPDEVWAQVDGIVADMIKRLRARGAAAATAAASVLDGAGLSTEQARAEHARLTAEFDAAFERAREIETAAGLQPSWLSTPEGRVLAAEMAVDFDERARDFAARWTPQGTATASPAKPRRKPGRKYLSPDEVHAEVEALAAGVHGKVNVPVGYPKLSTYVSPRVTIGIDHARRRAEALEWAERFEAGQKNKVDVPIGRPVMS